MGGSSGVVDFGLFLSYRRDHLLQEAEWTRINSSIPPFYYALTPRELTTPPHDLAISDRSTTAENPAHRTAPSPSTRYLSA